MHRKCYNNTAPPLFKQNVEQFKFSRILKLLKSIHISSHSLPPVRPGSTRPKAPVFSHNQCIIGRFTNLLFRRRFIQCAMVFPFIPYCLAFFLQKGGKLLTKGENTKNVSIGFQLRINNSEGACGYYYKMLVILFMGDC